jgi:hypothetical protein
VPCAGRSISTFFSPTVDCCCRVDFFRGFQTRQTRLQPCVTRTSAESSCVCLKTLSATTSECVDMRPSSATVRTSVSHLWILGLSWALFSRRLSDKRSPNGGNKLFLGSPFCVFVFVEFGKFLLSTTWPRVQWFKCKTGFSTTNISGGVGRRWATDTTTRPGSSTRKRFKMLQVSSVMEVFISGFSFTLYKCVSTRSRNLNR